MYLSLKIIAFINNFYHEFTKSGFKILDFSSETRETNSFLSNETKDTYKELLIDCVILDEKNIKKIKNRKIYDLELIEKSLDPGEYGKKEAKHFISDIKYKNRIP